MRFYFLLVSIAIAAILALQLYPGIRSEVSHPEKIAGVSLVSMPYRVDSADLADIATLSGAEYVALMPYGFSRKNAPEVYFNTERQWWGEKKEGINEMVKSARQNGYKIMIKPHVWVRGDGWPGEFELRHEEEWMKWEEDYRKYILDFAMLADSLDIELFCIGTEYRRAVIKRKGFWEALIRDVRKLYGGKVTYAANWDNYQNVSFWDQLDYIGVDSYFPLSKSKTPGVHELVKKWKAVKYQLSSYSSRYQKPVLFTEYGFQSVDFNTREPWKTEPENSEPNIAAQKNAYEAFYRTFWNETWVAGGFLWKWYPKTEEAGYNGNRRFTPQNKPAMDVIYSWYTNQ